MNIIVCVKKIPDPEIPPAKFRIDSELKQVLPPEGIPPVMSPYDEQAVELALRLKDKYEAKITVITIDSGADSSILKHALAMGADEGIILADKAFEGSDSFATAYILSLAIEKVGGYDLILCGRQAADWDEGLIGTIVAEKLGLPLVTLAEEIEVIDRDLKVKRVILDGYQVVSASPPVVVTVSNEVGQPRLPSGWGIITASKKQIPSWSARDLETNSSLLGSSAAKRVLKKLFIPERMRKCEVIEGETTAEASIALAEKLIQKGVI